MEITSKSAEKTPEGHLIPHNIIDSNNDCNLCSILLNGEDILFYDYVENFREKISYIIEYYKNIVNNFYVITYGEVYSDIHGFKLEILKEIFIKKGIYNRFFVRTSSNINNFNCNFQTSLFWLGKDIDKIKSPTSTNIKTHFLSLCRKVDYHREFIFYFLKNNGLLKKSSYSFSANNKNHIDYKSIEGDELSWDKSNNHTKLLKEYNECFLNINTESIFNSKINFLTEKTNKCFLTAQPFIMVSSPHTLKYLHELGFKTFDKWWDESYDLEEDNEKRLEKICELILKISKFSIKKCKLIYDDMIPILKYNQNNLIYLNKNQIDNTFYIHQTHYFNNKKKLI